MVLPRAACRPGDGADEGRGEGGQRPEERGGGATAELGEVLAQKRAQGPRAAVGVMVAAAGGRDVGSGVEGRFGEQNVAR